MRIRVKIQTEKIHGLYHSSILSLIKNAVSSKDTAYADKFLNDNKIPKNFTWSIQFDKTQAKKEIITLDNKEKETAVFYQNKDIYLYISSSDEKFMCNLIIGLQRMNIFFIAKDFELFIKEIEFCTEKTITENKANFIIRSPIIIENNDLPVFPDDPNYNLHFEYIVKKMYKLLNNQDIFNKKILFKEIKIRKQIVNLFISKSDILIKNTGILGTFTLEADKDILNFVFKNGIGLRRSYGFGMIDLIKQST